MFYYSRSKLSIILSLLVISSACLALLTITRLEIHATGWSLRFSTKPWAVHTTSAVSCGAWNIIASPSIGSGNTVLYGVAAINANNIWAVGYYTDNQGYNQALTEHWDGTSWSAIASANPGPGGNVLIGVVAVNASNVWAIGASWDISGNTSQALIERWNGKSWKAISNSNAGPGSYLFAVTRVPSTNQLWTVGTIIDSNHLYQTLIEFYC